MCRYRQTGVVISQPARRTAVAHLAWAVGAGVTVALVVVGTTRIEPGPGERPVDDLAYGLAALACAAVLTARWRPVAATGVVALALPAYVAANYPEGPVLLCGVLVLFVLGSTRSRRLAYGFAAAMAGLVVAASVGADRGPGVIDLLFVGWAAAAVFAADAIRGRRERAEARDREQRRRIVEERLRIARDLHDTVAHAMVTINVQAGMAGRVVDSRPELAKEALEVVRAASGRVLDELNAMVRVLRDGADGEAPLRPAPGLAELPELIAVSRHGGLEADLSIVGEPRVVAGSVDVAAYRIVQESLTNAARHGGSGRAAVVVRYEPDGLRVEVTNDLRGTPRGSRGAGAGIAGMRERAAATGGRLSAGDRPDGGFGVTAYWPGAGT